MCVLPYENAIIRNIVPMNLFIGHLTGENRGVTIVIVAQPARHDILTTLHQRARILRVSCLVAAGRHPRSPVTTVTSVPRVWRFVLRCVWRRSMAYRHAARPLVVWFFSLMGLRLQRPGFFFFFLEQSAADLFFP